LTYTYTVTRLVEREPSSLLDFAKASVGLPSFVEVTYIIESSSPDLCAEEVFVEVDRLERKRQASLRRVF